MQSILAVDDSASMRKMVAFTLTGAGFHVVEAVDGQDAFEKAQTHHIDLVLTDLSMPKLDGVSLARRIRTTESPPPIILMSGNVSAEDAELLVRTDFVAALHKPVDPDELFRVLAEVFEQAPPQAGRARD